MSKSKVSLPAELQEAIESIKENQTDPNKLNKLKGITDRLIEMLDEPTHRWVSSGDVYWLTSGTFDSITPGLFKTGHSDNIGYFIERMTIQTDDLIRFPDLICNDVIDQVNHFWKPETRDRMNELGFIHKRGLMMYGPPGCGKTCTIQIIIENIIKEGGIVLYSERANEVIYWLKQLRMVEPDRNIVVLLEDFDDLVEDRESKWLALLDGEYQVDGVVFLATTNYIKKIDKRFINRPSRFDLIVKVPPISAESRGIYFKHKLPELREEVNAETLDNYVEMTEGFQIAHLREFIISTECFGKSPKEAQDQLMRQIFLASSKDIEKKGNVGRALDDDDEADFFDDVNDEAAEELEDELAVVEDTTERARRRIRKALVDAPADAG